MYMVVCYFSSCSIPPVRLIVQTLKGNSIIAPTCMITVVLFAIISTMRSHFVSAGSHCVLFGSKLYYPT